MNLHRSEAIAEGTIDYLQSFLANSVEAFAEYDAELRYLALNPVAAALIGLQPADVMGKTPQDLLALAIATPLKAALLEMETAVRQALETAATQLVIHEIPTNAGLKVYQTSYTPVVNTGGSPVRVISLGRDITQQQRLQQQTQAELQKTQNLLQLHTENSPLAVIEWDENFRVTRWSGRAQAIFGWSAAEVVGKAPQDWQIVHEADAAVVNKLMAELLAGACAYQTLENRNYTKSGKIIHCQWFNSIVRQGDSFTILSLVEDTTARQQAVEALQEKETFLQLILNNIPQSIFWKDRNSVYLGCNETFAQAAGVSTPEALLGKTDYDLPWSQLDAAWYRECDRRVMETDTPVMHLIEPILQTDGTQGWADTNKVPIHDAEGKVIGILGTFEDITERRQAEKIRKSAELLQLVLDNIPQYIFWKDRNCVYMGCNQKWAEAMGIGEPENIIGKTDFDLRTLEEATRCREADNRVMAADTPQLHILDHHVTTNGQQVWLDVNKTPIHDAAGQVVGILVMLEDITDRKRAEEELQRSEAQFRELAQREQLLNQLANQIRNSLNLDTILSTTVNEIRNFLAVDRCNFLWYIYEPENARFELTHEAHNPKLPSVLGQYSIQNPDNPYLQALLQAQAVRADDLYTDTCLDEQMRSRLITQGYFSHLSFPIQTHSGKLGIITCAHCGGPRPWEDDEVQLLQAVANQLAIALDQAELYEQSRTAAIAAKAQAQRLEQALHDLRHTQTQLIQTEKMSSLGQLVAGIAHEINNPVNFIHGNLNHTQQYTQDLLHLLQLYHQHYPQPNTQIQTEAERIDLDFLIEDLPKMVASMQVGAQRIRQIVLTLRNFSRLDEAEMKPVDIHEGIESTLLILCNRLKLRLGHLEIQVTKEYGLLPKVECYAGQLNQVFMNILSNAIDALEQAIAQQPEKMTRSPEIWIRTEILERDRVVIRIADNGPGMTEAVQRQLFDPFFTTKPVGEGTGLGLSISYQIVVEKHGGVLQCVSQPGEGTEFWIEIPISPSQPEARSNSTRSSFNYL